MIIKQPNAIGSGFIIVKPTPMAGYDGVGREMFYLELIADEVDPECVKADMPFWRCYPPGWRQQAYRLIEENLVHESNSDDGSLIFLDLIADYECANQVITVITPHLGKHEILLVDIYRNASIVDEVRSDSSFAFYGYDVAYPGGDMFSPIADSLFLNPEPRLSTIWRPRLNRRGLFEVGDYVGQFMSDYLALVSEEQQSEFMVYAVYGERDKLDQGDPS